MPRDTPKELRERDERYRVRTADHVSRYLASDGEDGFDDNTHKAPTLILFTTGRRSGNEVATPLYYAESDGSYIVIASYAGADAHPKWYLNLVDHPTVEVQIHGNRFAASARTAEGHEKLLMWPLLASSYGFYNDYQQATDRVIPLVVLEPSER